MQNAGIRAVRGGDQRVWWWLCKGIAERYEVAACRDEFVEVDDQASDGGRSCSGCTEVRAGLNLPAVGVIKKVAVDAVFGTFGGFEVNDEFDGLRCGSGKLFLD